MERMCSICRGVFDESKFRLIKKKKPSGLRQYRSGICLACEREKQSAYYYDRLEREYQRGRADAIDECVMAIEERKSLFDNSTRWTMAEKERLIKLLKGLKGRNNGKE